MFNSVGFISYLQNIGIILEDFQIEEFNRWSQDTDEMIFFLSNYLSALTTAQFFEIAKSLMNNFQKQQQRQVKEDQKEDQLLQQQKQKNEEKPIQDKNTYERNNNIQSQTQRIHEKLYKNAFEKMEFQTLLGQLQKDIEKQNCPFSPNLYRNKYQQKLDQQNDQQVVFDRLSQTKCLNLQSNHKLGENQFDKLDILDENCTFQPNINKNYNSNNKQIGNHLNKSMSVSTFDRLYKDAIDKQKKIEFSNSFTKPNTNKDQPEQSENRTIEISNRLYQEHIDRQMVEMMNAMNKNEKEMENCTFKPQLFPNQYNKKIENSQQTQNQSAEKNKQSHQYFSNQQQKSDIFGKLYEQSKLKQINQQITQMQVNKQEINTRKSRTPKINKISQAIQNQDPFHERLYKDYKKKDKIISDLTQKISKEQGCSFTPKINNKSKNQTYCDNKNNNIFNTRNKENQENQEKSAIRESLYQNSKILNYSNNKINKNSQQQMQTIEYQSLMNQQTDIFQQNIQNQQQKQQNSLNKSSSFHKNNLALNMDIIQNGENLFKENQQQLESQEFVQLPQTGKFNDQKQFLMDNNNSENKNQSIDQELVKQNKNQSEIINRSYQGFNNNTTISSQIKNNSANIQTSNQKNRHQLSNIQYQLKLNSKNLQQYN